MVCFLILHYIVMEETKKCVDSILNNVDGEKHVLIVDNCSPNDSYAKLCEIYKGNEIVTIIQNVSNNGFAKGNNFGYRYAKKIIQPDFICCMNNDMEIKQPDFIAQIYDIYDRTHYAVLGPDVYSVSAKKHQNPEHKTMRLYDEVCKKLDFFKKRARWKSIFYIKGFLKNIHIINLLYYFVKEKGKKESNEWTDEIIGTALHGSCLIFSPIYIKLKEDAFFSGTMFYCEAQILDYECQRDNLLMVYSPKLSLLHHEDVATNAVFKQYAKKAIFINECMIESLEAFKLLMEGDGKQNLS